MSPSQFHAKKDFTTKTINNNNMPPPLKINKGSHLIKKSSSFSSLSPPSSSSSSSSLSLVSTSTVSGAVALNKPPQRHPVIIYTHSPKVIHTHPRDFMALVQKLTGLSRSDEDGNDNNLPPPKQPMQEPVSNNVAPVLVSKESGRKNVGVGIEDNETSSVITEESNCTNGISENQVNSCFVSPRILEPLVNPYLANLPVFPPPNSSEFMCSSQSLLNYPNSFYFSHNMRSSLEGVNEFHEY